MGNHHTELFGPPDSQKSRYSLNVSAKKMKGTAAIQTTLRAAFASGVSS
jgi:hypothetical protein